MDLSTLKFEVDTSRLADAILVIDKLGESVDRLAAPISALNKQSKTLDKSLGDAGKSAGDAGKAIKEGVAEPAEEASKSLSKVEAMIQKAGLSLAVLTNQTVSTADGTYDVVASFTRMQARLLSTALQAGATSSEMQTLASIIEKTNAAMGTDPFDKSASGLAMLKKDVKELNTLYDLQAQGLALNAKELKAYAQDIERVKIAYDSQGKSSAELEQRLQTLRNETLQYSAEKAKLVQQSKDNEAALKAEAAAILASENASKQTAENYKKNFDYRVRFNQELKDQDEKASKDALALLRQQYEEESRLADKSLADERKRAQEKIDIAERAIRKQEELQQKMAIQEKFVGQGFSSASSGKAAMMQIQGVPEDTIQSYLKVTQGLESATKATRAKAAANEYLTQTEASLKARLEETNNTMTAEHTQRVVDITRAVKTMGLSAEETAKQIAHLSNMVGQVATKDRTKQLDNLARGMSVQLGDVGVSLAGGMNPLTVLIQQGDQIRGLLTQAGASSQELKATMSTAFTQIASSVTMTGKAIGGFFVTALTDAGTAVLKFSGQLPGISILTEGAAKMMADFKTKADAGSVSMQILTKVTAGLGVAITALSAVGVLAVITALSMAAIAVYKVYKETDEMTRSMVFASGALGLTRNQADQAALSMKSLGVDTTSSNRAIMAMGAAGNLGADAIAMITKAAYELEKVGGPAIEETVKVFSSIADKPLEALFKVQKQTGSLSAETLASVEALILQGKEFEAAGVAANAYRDLLVKQTDDLKTNYTVFGKFMIDFGNSIVRVWTRVKDTIRGLFVEDSDVSKITKLGEKLAQAVQAKNGYAEGKAPVLVTAEVERLKAELAALVATTNAENERTKTAQVNAELQQEASKLRLKNLSAEQKMMMEVKQAAENRDRMLAAGNKVDAQAFSDQQIKIVEEYNEKINKVKDSTKKLTQAEKDALSVKKAGEKMLEDVASAMQKNVAVTENLNDAEKLRLKIYSDPRFASQPVQMKKELAAALDLLDGKNRLADAEKNKLKADQAADGLLGQADGKTKEYAATMKVLEQAILDAGSGNEAFVQRMRDAIKALEDSTPAAKAHAKAMEELKKITVDVVTETGNLAESYQTEVDSLLMSTAAREKANKVRKIEVDYRKQLQKLGQEFIKTDKGDEAVKTLKDAIAAANENREFQIDLIDKEENLKLIREVIDGLQKGMSAAIDRIFRGDFKGAGATLRSAVEEALRKPFNIVVNAITDGVKNSLVDGAKSMLGDTAKGAFGKLFTTGALSAQAFSAYGTSFGQAFISSTTGAGFTASTTSGVVAGANSAGGAAASTTGLSGSAMAGAVASYAAGIYAGSEIGKKISNGYSTGGSGNTVVNAATLIGAFFGPLGALVGGAVGGVFNRAFGRKLTEQGITGNINGESLNATNYSVEKGGFFRSDKRSTSELDPELATALNDTFGALVNSTKLYAETLGLGTDSLKDFSKSFTLNTKDKSAEEVQKMIGEVFTQSANEMADLILGITKKVEQVQGRGEYDASNTGEAQFVRDEAAAKRLLKEGETSAAALGRLSNALVLVNGSFTLLGVTLRELSVKGAESSDKLIELFGGVEKMTASLDAYYTSFYSKEEQLLNTRKNLTAELDKLGVSLDSLTQGKTAEDAKSSYRQEVTQAFNSGDDKKAVALVNLSQMFVSLFADLESASGSLSETMKSLNSETANLNVEILRLQGKTNEADAAFKAISTEGMSAAEVKVWETNNALKKQVDVLTQRKQLEEELATVGLTTAQLRELEISKLDETNQGLARDINARKDIEEKRQKDLELTTSLEEDYLKLTMTTAQLREAEIEKMSLYNRILAVRNDELEREAKVAEKAADERKTIDEEYNQLTMTTAQLRALEISKLEPGNQALAKRNDALKAEADLLEEAAAQRKTLQEEFDQLTMTSTELRLKERSTIADDNKELFDKITAAKKAKDVETERAGLEERLNQLTKTSAELRELEVLAVDSSNQAIMRQIQTLQIAASVAQERQGLERKMLEVQGDTAAIRDLELKALDESNRALQKDIWALEDKKIADQEAAQAAQAAAQAAQQLKSAWKSLTDSIYDEVRRIRGLMASPADNFSDAQKRFNDASAKAVAGDQDAAKSLPELSKALLEMAKLQARSLAELRAIEGMTAFTLEMTADSLARRFGIAVPAFASGGAYGGGVALVGETGPELINFDSPGQISNSATTANMLDNASMVEAINRLNSNVEGLRFEVRADVQHNAKTAKLLDRVIKDGETISVSFDTAQNVKVVV